MNPYDEILKRFAPRLGIPGMPGGTARGANTMAGAAPKPFSWGGAGGNGGWMGGMQADFEKKRLSPEDYTSSSSSGLDPWAARILSNTTGRLMPGMMKGYSQSLRDLDKNPALIEQKRQELNTQFSRDIQAPTMAAVNNATAGAAARGVVGGSSYNDQVGQISQAANQAAQQQQSASNTWASDALIQNIMAKLQARQAGMGLLGDMAGMGTSSRSTDPTAWMRLGSTVGPAN